jgi:hypothetical protein
MVISKMLFFKNTTETVYLLAKTREMQKNVKTRASTNVL